MWVDVARTYNGEDGAEKLLEQGTTTPRMVEAMHGAGVQAIKMRGRHAAPARRSAGSSASTASPTCWRCSTPRCAPDAARRRSSAAARFDNYAWHTDLPPGHPMVTGSQTVDFDLFAASTPICCGMGHEWDLHQDARFPLD